jgi:peptide/nickel transport system ATP-binding protein
MKQPLLSINNLKKYYPLGSGMFKAKAQIKAVDGVYLDIHEGETVGLVGESGCGKSTVGKLVVGLIEPTEGTVVFHGKDSKINKRRGQDLQMVFQDPYSSLNPRMQIENIISEPLRLHKYGTKEEMGNRVKELLDVVGLPMFYKERYPDELSGGQRQRVAIARALALNPKLIVCDEPVSALDVSIQAQILNLLKDIQSQMGVSYLFIGHGIQAVNYVSHRIAVMYLGEIVEIGNADDLFLDPKHPYTSSLKAAIPLPDPALRDRERIILEGDLPSNSNPPSGCRFHTRCPVAIDRCKIEKPVLKKLDENRYLSCLLFN